MAHSRYHWSAINIGHMKYNAVDRCNLGYGWYHSMNPKSLEHSMIIVKTIGQNIPQIYACRKELHYTAIYCIRIVYLSELERIQIEIKTSDKRPSEVLSYILYTTPHHLNSLNLLLTRH